MTRGRTRNDSRTARPSRYSFSKVDADFESDGLRCAGWLYRPDRPANPPVVVMAPGFAAERAFGLPAIAERFAAAGYAVFLFDYRHVGDSEGAPRNLVSVSRQLDDWRAAIDHVRTLDGVRGHDPALWGFSLAGGHVVRLAAEMRPAAAIALAPMVDGLAVARTRPLSTLVRGAVAGVRDALGGVVGRPHTVPAVGDPDEFAVLNDPGAKTAVLRTVPPEADWQNEVPARCFLSLPRYRPIAEASDVSCPTLFVAGSDDGVVSASVVERAADAVQDSTFVRMPLSHFEAIQGRAFEQVVGHQLAFLDGVMR